jgi:hypothetical protein
MPVFPTGLKKTENTMKMMPMGDYYVWYCEWCDSRNLTLWTRIETGHVSCGACHTAFPMPGAASLRKERALSQVI